MRYVSTRGGARAGEFANLPVAGLTADGELYWADARPLLADDNLRRMPGDLIADDLPGAWRDGMRELVGIAPEDDRDGCLQDIHWFDGTVGYFPTYTMGALAAAQLFAAARAAVPDLLDAIGAGDFAPLLAWLRANVHEKASSATTDELLAAATGAPLGVAAFEAHLKDRYLAAA